MKDTKERRVNLWPIVYGILLTAFAVFILLDAFVLPKKIVTVDPPPEGENPVEEDAVITENSYVSENVAINISVWERFDTQIYVADVVLKDPSFLKAGLANGAFGRNVMQKTSSMARTYHAILAINGDYYGFRERGYVMRNGYLYRDFPQRGAKYEDLVIYQDGHFEIIDETEVDAEELVKAGAEQIFSFGPGLIREGAITVGENSKVDLEWNGNPRTAIGEIEPLHYVFVVSDGRTEESVGLSLFQLAQVMQELNCQNAYNLDGGDSATMCFMGEIVNKPNFNGEKLVERSVSDIVYIGK